MPLSGVVGRRKVKVGEDRHVMDAVVPILGLDQVLEGFLLAFNFAVVSDMVSNNAVLLWR